MTRPTTISGLSSSDFIAYYWLKSELVEFCRANKLATTGSKKELTTRIWRYLETGEVGTIKVMKPRLAASASSHAKMPTSFTRDTLIGAGWRCSQELRSFFESELGPTFHFNQFMRNFIKRDGVGQTLEVAIEGWQRDRTANHGDREIAPQFEYNRHFRAYFAQNPGATRDDAIRAWHQTKARRKDSRPEAYPSASCG